MRLLLPLILGVCTIAAQTPEVQRLLDESESQKNQQHFEAAVQIAQQAIDLSLATSDKKGLTRAYRGLSWAYSNWRKLDASLTAAKQGEAVAAEIRDTEFQVYNLNLAGSSLRDQGKLDEALAIYNRALDIGRSTNDRVLQAGTLRMIAIVYRMSGDYNRAISLTRESLIIGRELKKPVLEGYALNALGTFEWEQQHYDLARDYFSDGLKVPLNDSALRDQLLNGLAGSYCGLKQYDRCIEANRQQLKIALEAKNPGRIAEGYQRLSEAQVLAGALGDAYDSALKALTTLRSSDHILFDEWGFQQTVGERLLALKRDWEAVTYFHEGITLVERLRQGLVPTEQARAASVAYTKPLFDDMIDTLFGLDPSQSLQTVELSRARAFLSILAESKIDLRQNLSAVERDRETALFARLSAIQKSLSLPNVTAGGRKQRNADLESAEDDMERLHLEIRRSNPRLASVQYPKPLGLEQIQRELKPGVALIEYYLGDKRSFVWVVSHNRSSSAVLPPAKDIAALAGAYRKSLTSHVSGLTARQSGSESLRLSAHLYEMLLKPVEQSLEGSQSLIIVPDGVLYYVPFEALQAAGNSRYLFERFPISYAPSATSLAELEHSSPPARQKMLLAFGDPIYARSAAATERGLDLGALPYTRDEVTGIASLFPKGESAVYLGSRASQESVRGEALDRYRYIHFATHGVLDESHPSRSGLALTAGGILQVDEITGLRIHADVVTLSACSTGLGELVSGEGMLGLVRSFLYAGASSVAVSLWNVNDDATATLMKEFYRNLSRSVPPQEALRRAKISLIHQGNALWHHPHFWAPFVLWLR